MSVVWCTEPERVPRTLRRPVVAGGTVSVWALDVPPESRDTLRSTALRASEPTFLAGSIAREGAREGAPERSAEGPPEGGRLVVELDVVRSPGGPTVLRVRRLGPGVNAELVRAEARSRLMPGSELRERGRIEAVWVEGPRVEFVLEVMTPVVHTTRLAVAGAGARRVSAVMPQRGALWLVPSAWELLADWEDVVRDMAFTVGKRLGLSSRTLAWIMSSGFFVLSAVGVWYAQYEATRQTEVALEEAQEDLATAQGTRSAAVQGEAACLDERAALVSSLGQIDAERMLQAERALSPTLARIVARDEGGARMEQAALVERDQLRLGPLRDAVVARMEAVTTPPDVAAPCLGLDPLLGTDLPRYVLVWHADPGQVCPASYDAVLGGAQVRGRWGLSARMVRDRADDLRAVDREAATVLLEGLRRTTLVLLGHEAGGRPPVAPVEAHLWALSLLGAYNRLPSPVDGALDQPLEVCLGQALDDLATQAGVSSPGEPLLPSLLSVASGDKPVIFRPTPGCAWPADAVTLGVEASLAAVARSARLDLLEP